MSFDPLGLEYYNDGPTYTAMLTSGAGFISNNAFRQLLADAGIHDVMRDNTPLIPDADDAKMTTARVNKHNLHYKRINHFGSDRVGGGITNEMQGVEYTFSRMNIPVAKPLGFTGGINYTNKIYLSAGLYIKVTAPNNWYEIPNLDKAKLPRTFTARFELGQQKGNYKIIGSAKYALLEYDINISALRWMLTPSPPQKDRGENQTWSDAPTKHIYLPIAATGDMLDITDLAAFLPADMEGQIPAFDPSRDAAFADANGQARTLELDTDAAWGAIQTLLPDSMRDYASALAYAPMAMTTAQYAPTVVRGARILRGVGTFLSAGEGALLAATTGKALVYADLIGAGLEGLTSESALEYYATGQVSTETAIHDALGYSNLAMGAPVFESWMQDDATITYPRILDALQTARADDTQAVKAQSAAQVIETTPALRYLDALETYAKAHGLEGGAYGADAAQIAEALVQGAAPEERDAILADLAEQFGLTRENADLSQKGDWWVTATDVDRGNGQPLKSTRKPIDALAFWRSDSDQAIVQDERAIKVVGGIVPALGTHLFPEVIDKNKAPATRPTAEFRN